MRVVLDHRGDARVADHGGARAGRGRSGRRRAARQSRSDAAAAEQPLGGVRQRGRAAAPAPPRSAARRARRSNRRSRTQAAAPARRRSRRRDRTAPRARRRAIGRVSGKAAAQRRNARAREQPVAHGAGSGRARDEPGRRAASCGGAVRDARARRIRRRRGPAPWAGSAAPRARISARSSAAPGQARDRGDRVGHQPLEPRDRAVEAELARRRCGGRAPRRGRPACRAPRASPATSRMSSATW